MLKNKKILTILLAIVMVLAIPTIVNAAVEYTRNFPDNTGTIELNLTGLELSDSKQYEFSLVPKGGTPEYWNLITNYTTSTAKLVLSSAESKIVNVLKVTDDGQIFIREKDATEGYIKKDVNLKLPYLQSLVYTKHDSGYYQLFGNLLYGGIGDFYEVSSAPSHTYIQWQKVTDIDLITKFLETKNSNGSLLELEDNLPGCPTMNWEANRNPSSSDKNDGLYLLWVKRTGDNCKEVYSCIVHDGLPEATTVAQYIGEQDVSVESVELNYPTMTLEPGKSLNLVPTIKPENATNKNVTYVSSNSEVATVDATGKVTAIKAGTATITVTTAEGEKKATCTVTVTEPSNEPTDEPSNEEWTDFSNAKFIAKANSYKALTINLENITLDKNNLYYMYISKNNKEQPVVDYEKCARILEDDEGKLLATFYNDYSRTILEEVGQNYIYVIGRNSEGAEKILVNAKKMDYPVLPGLGKIFDIYLYDSTNSYFHNYIDISSTRTITYKIGKVTSNDVLKSLKNDSTDVSFANLLDYAKNATPLKTGTMKPEDLKYNIAKDITIEEEAYYFVYMIADTENGKYNYIEDVAIYKENNDENGNALVHFTFADIEIDEPEKEPVKDPVKDNTNAPVKLPNTGNTVFVVVGIVALVVLSTIGLIKYKKFSKIV